MVSHANWQSAICASFGGNRHQAGKIINLFALDSNMLQVQVLRQLIALVVGDHRRRTADHRAFDRLPNKAAILYLRKRNLIHITTALRADLNQPIFRQFIKASRTG